jgi:hypothetical protein
MLLDDELQAFANLQFVLECEEIRLRQLGTNKPRIVRGPGKIFQKSDGKLYFELQVKRGQLHLPRAEALGEILPLATYYSLKTVDSLGREWKCAQAHPEVPKGRPGRSDIVCGEVFLLRGTRRQTPSPGTKHSVIGYVFSAGSRLHGVSFAMGSTQVQFTPGSDRMLVRANQEGRPLPASFGQRMLEALRFVTGALASWSVLIVAGPERTEISLNRIDRRALEALPPIAENTTVSARATEDLFRCYLKYALREKRPLWLHRLSAEWGEVLRANGGSLQTQATIWCIVVEGLLALVVLGRRLGRIVDPAQRKRLRVWRGRVLKYLEDRKCPDPIRNRFRGATDRWLEPSTREVMKKLGSIGAVDGNLEKRWGRLRNPSAHADREGQGHEDALFRECMAVLALLYQLSFYLIGYEGYFSDYAAKGWPLRKYPLKYPLK